MRAGKPVKKHEIILENGTKKLIEEPGHFIAKKLIICAACSKEIRPGTEFYRHMFRGDFQPYHLHCK